MTERHKKPRGPIGLLVDLMSKILPFVRDEPIAAVLLLIVGSLMMLGATMVTLFVLHELSTGRFP